MKLLAKLEADNHMGRIELSPNSTTHPYLLYSTSFRDGNLIVYDTNRLEETCVMRCHKSAILKFVVNY